MNLYAKLQQTLNEEDIKDAYIQAWVLNKIITNL